jgi:hypothetical protein
MQFNNVITILEYESDKKNLLVHRTTITKMIHILNSENPFIKINKNDFDNDTAISTSRFQHSKTDSHWGPVAFLIDRDEYLNRVRKAKIKLSNASPGEERLYVNIPIIKPIIYGIEINKDFNAYHMNLIDVKLIKPVKLNDSDKKYLIKLKNVTIKYKELFTQNSLLNIKKILYQKRI